MGKVNPEPFETISQVCTKMGERKNKKNKAGKNIFGNSEVTNIGKKLFVEKFGKVKISSSYGRQKTV